jgi:ATP-dependent Clp protease ATP-binding subunit ClpA
MNQHDVDLIARKMLTQQTTFASLFDKFSERARKALVYAHDEARLLNHSYIGTEHILLGLVRENEGVTAQVLKELSIDLSAVRTFVEQVVKRGEPLPDDIERPLTPRVQVVLMMALGETWRLPPLVEPEHLLLALVREGEGIAAGALESLGAPLDQVRSLIFQKLVNRAVISTESLKDTIKKANVVTCRIDDHDLNAIDALVEVGIRSTRSDAAAWLIHAGVEANRAVLDSVYATVVEIHQLRAKAQSMALQIKVGSTHPSPGAGKPESAEK